MGLDSIFRIQSKVSGHHPHFIHDLKWRRFVLGYLWLAVTIEALSDFINKVSYFTPKLPVKTGPHITVWHIPLTCQLHVTFPKVCNGKRKLVWPTVQSPERAGIACG